MIRMYPSVPLRLYLWIALLVCDFSFASPLTLLPVSRVNRKEVSNTDVYCNPPDPTHQLLPPVDKEICKHAIAKIQNIWEQDVPRYWRGATLFPFNSGACKIAIVAPPTSAVSGRFAPSQVLESLDDVFSNCASNGTGGTSSISDEPYGWYVAVAGRGILSASGTPEEGSSPHVVLGGVAPIID